MWRALAILSLPAVVSCGKAPPATCDLPTVAIDKNPVAVDGVFAYYRDGDLVVAIYPRKPERPAVIDCAVALSGRATDRIELTFAPGAAAGTVAYALTSPLASGITADPGDAAPCKAGTRCTRVRAQITGAPHGPSDRASACVSATAFLIDGAGAEHELTIHGLWDAPFCVGTPSP